MFITSHLQVCGFLFCRLTLRRIIESKYQAGSVRPKRQGLRTENVAEPSSSKWETFDASSNSGSAMSPQLKPLEGSQPPDLMGSAAPPTPSLLDEPLPLSRVSPPKQHDSSGVSANMTGETPSSSVDRKKKRRKGWKKVKDQGKATLSL